MQHPPSVITKANCRIPPDTNVERQRRFRERHPGYNNKYRPKARIAAYRARLTELEAQKATPPPLALFAPMQLCLPAPTVSIEMEEINAMRRKLEREAVVVRR